MKISKFKLKQGTYPFISYLDGNVVGDKNYPSTEAPPKMMKTMMTLNSHLTEITEQFDKSGEHDYDNICVRSYSISDKDTIILTGLRTLQNGGSLLLNSKSISLSIEDSEYPKIGQLLVCLENMQTEIEKFMKANPSQDDVQGKLQFTKPENVVVASEKTETERTEAALNGEETDVTDLYLPKEDKPKKGRNKPAASEMLDLLPTEQEKMDAEMPITEEMRQKAMSDNAAKNKAKKK